MYYIMINKKSIETNFRCNICNKFYASKSSLCHHNKKFHSVNPTILPQNPTILPQKIIECNYCKKIFSRNDSLKRHNKICKNKNLNNDTKFEDFKNNILEILKTMKVHPKKLQKINKDLLTFTTNNIINNTTNTNNTNNTNNTTNNTINNTTNNTLNNNINITYIKFGNEKLSQLLSKKEMKKIINKVRSSVEESIKLVHFNDKRPEYKNILITNMKDNLAYVFNGKKFEVVSKDSALNNLFNDHMCNIECFLDDNNIEETFKNKQLFNFRREINGESKNYDISNYKAYKINEIKQLIYNNSSSKLLKKLNSLELEEKVLEYPDTETFDEII